MSSPPTLMGGSKIFRPENGGGKSENFYSGGGWPNGGDVRKWGGGFKFEGGFLEMKSIFRVNWLKMVTKKLKNSILD